MTTLYRPVKIESAEQAEALPLGTVSIDLDSQGQPYQASIRVRGGWYCTGEVAADGSPWLASHDVMTGDTALVPIEAEEEYGAEMKWDDRTPDDTHVSLGLSLDNARWQAENNPDYATGRIMRQYRTPWEEA